MGKTIQGSLIDRDLRPAYYDKFHCLITDCQLNCCKGWRISFDRGDYLTLKHTKGSPELNKRLSHALHRIRGDDLKKYFAEFDMSSGICPLLREDGLCLLQMEKGARAQPFVCRSFPRHEINTCFGFFEHSLTPACEGVLALLWDLPEGIDFICSPLPPEKRTIQSFQSALGFSSGDFQSIRSACIDILQDRRNPLPERIFLMGIALKQLIDGETDLSRWQANIPNISGVAVLKQLDSAGNDAMQMMCILNNVRVLCSIGQSSDGFQEIQKSIISSLGLSTLMRLKYSTAKISFSKVTASGEKISLNGLQEQIQGKSQKDALSAYQTAKARYQEQFGDKEYFMENLMVAVFFHLHLPNMDNLENFWKSYVNFCNTYSFFRFMAVMSCRKGDKKELFHLIVQASRNLLHNSQRQEALAEQFFQNESSTLAHMAVLLSG